MRIPLLNETGELPDGEYDVTLDAIENRFGCANEQRRFLMQSLRAAAANFSKANVRKLWIDGSFLTNKEHPNDIDGVWETNDQIDLAVLNPVFRSGLPFPVFLRTNRENKPKGILVVRLGE